MSKTYVFTAFGGPDGQDFIDRPVPEPGPGELLIEVRAAGVNPADWKIRAGYLGTDRELPTPMGIDVAGVVMGVGPDAGEFAVGDEVLGPVSPGQGSFAEHTVVQTDAVVRKPESLSFIDAAALPTAGATAYDAMHQLGLEKGQTVLILGIGGGVGVISTQIARVHGFTVIGTGSEDKREFIESLDATLVPYGEDVADRIITVAPDGVDAILDLIGGQELREVAGLVADRSRIMTTVDPATATELGGGSVKRDHTKESLESLISVVDVGLVDPKVSKVYSFDQTGQAVASVESGHARGKVVITLTASTSTSTN